MCNAFVKLVQDIVSEKLNFDNRQISERSVKRQDSEKLGVLIVLEEL